MDGAATEDSHCMFEMEAVPAAPPPEDQARADTGTGAADGAETAIITPGAYSGGNKLPEASFHPDGNREIRSMILAALPMPPMPVLACKELPGEQSFVDTELKAISSHDLIAHMMNVSCTVVSESKNEERKKLQWALQDQLFKQLDEWQASNDPGGEKQLLPPPEFGYMLLGEYTRMYIQSYMPDPTKAQDIRFLPASEVDRGHIVWKKALEFQKAQDVLYGPCTFGGGTRTLQNLEYGDLVQHSIRRMMASAQC